MRADPFISPTPAVSGIAVGDLLEVLDGFSLEDRRDAIHLLLDRVTVHPGSIAAAQAAALSGLLFALATITLADAALADLDVVTPENAEAVLDALHKLYVARAAWERNAASAASIITPATVAALVEELAAFLREVRAEASPRLLH